MNLIGGADSFRYFKIISVNYKKIKNEGRYKTKGSPGDAAKKAFTQLSKKYKTNKLTFSIKETTQDSPKKTYGPYLGKKTKLKKPLEIKYNGKNKPVIIKYETKIHLVKDHKQKGGMLSNEEKEKVESGNIGVGNTESGAIMNNSRSDGGDGNGSESVGGDNTAEKLEKWGELYKTSKPILDELKELAVLHQNKKQFRDCMERLENHYEKSESIGTVVNEEDFTSIFKLLAKHMNIVNGVNINIPDDLEVSMPGTEALVLQTQQRTYIFRAYFPSMDIPWAEWYNSLLGCNMKPPISAEAFSTCYFKLNTEGDDVKFACYSYETLIDALHWLGNIKNANYEEKKKKFMIARSVLITHKGVKHNNSENRAYVHNILIKEDDEGNITALYCDMGDVDISGHQSIRDIGGGAA